MTHFLDVQTELDEHARRVRRLTDRGFLEAHRVSKQRGRERRTGNGFSGRRLVERHRDDRAEPTSSTPGSTGRP